MFESRKIAKSKMILTKREKMLQTKWPFSRNQTQDSKN